MTPSRSSLPSAAQALGLLGLDIPEAGDAQAWSVRVDGDVQIHFQPAADGRILMLAMLAQEFFELGADQLLALLTLNQPGDVDPALAVAIDSESGR